MRGLTAVVALLGLNLGLGLPGAQGAPPEPGASPDSAKSPAKAATKPASPAPPVEYLRTGARLYNEARYDMAAKYLAAAHRFRDKLTENERIVLDVYREELENHQKKAREGVVDPAVVTASTTSMVPAVPAAAGEGAANSGTQAAAPALLGPLGTPGRGSGARLTDPLPAPGVPLRIATTNIKQKGRWMLHEAREQILRKNFDAAKQKTDEVQAMNVKWGRFDDSPTKVYKAIEQAQAATARKAPDAAEPAAADTPAANP